MPRPSPWGWLPCEGMDSAAATRLWTQLRPCDRRGRSVGYFVDLLRGDTESFARQTAEACRMGGRRLRMRLSAYAPPPAPPRRTAGTRGSAPAPVSRTAPHRLAGQLRRGPFQLEGTLRPRAAGKRGRLRTRWLAPRRHIAEQRGPHVPAIHLESHHRDHRQDGDGRCKPEHAHVAQAFLGAGRASRVARYHLLYRMSHAVLPGEHGKQAMQITHEVTEGLSCGVSDTCFW